MELSRPLYESLRLELRHEGDAGHARREAQSLARRMGWSEEDCGRLALVVTEASTNTLLHGGGGELLIRSPPQGHALEVLALDKGPGMANVSRCMEDGYSSAGSRGVGMGGMRRLADYLDIYSQPQRGTALLAEIRPRSECTPAALWSLGVVCVALEGEPVAGDAWAVQDQPGRTVLTVIDGLGHGPLAAKASQAGTQAFASDARLRPEELLASMHEALRPTRGAAAAVAEVQWGSGQARFAGIGNIAGAIFESPRKRQSCVSYNGIVGEGQPRMRQFDHAFPNASLLVLASDGLSTRWDLDPYPGLFMRTPALIAGVLYRDFNRRRDDATVLVLRGRPAAWEPA